MAELSDQLGGMLTIHTHSRRAKRISSDAMVASLSVPVYS
jgi:hypothetical protein